MLVIGGFLLTILLGLLITLLVVPKMHPVERLGLSYVLGLGFLTLFMFFSYLVGFKFSFVNTLNILLVLTLALLLPTRRKIIPYITNLKTYFTLTYFTRIEKLIIIALAFLAIFSLISTLYYPVNAWDALVLYDWRAKLFVATGSMEDAISRGYFFGVPLLTSLAHTWVYFLNGKQPEFIYTLFFISFLAMFYGTLREFTTRSISLGVVLIVATIPDIFKHSTFAYTNLAYTVYFVMASIYLYIWMAKEKKGYLFLSALMLGLSTWTRSTEPFWLINLMILIIYSLYKRKIWQLLLFAFLFFSIRQPWVIFENSKLTLDTTVSGRVFEGISVILHQFNFKHALLIFGFVYNNLFSQQIIYWLGFLIFMVKERNFNPKGKKVWLTGMIIGYALLVIVGTYVFSLTFSDWKIGGSLARMAMFFPPLILFYIASSKKLKELIKY